jgi:hypothetical protein
MSNATPWSLAYARNETSQFGEDGILERLFELIGVENGWCVEFGAADGEWCSNTCQLIRKKGFSAVLIEADRPRYEALTKISASNPKLTVMNRFVGFGPTDNLDVILKETKAPKNLDLVSIDIDGNDYHVWDALKEYQPRVVVIEYNFTIPSAVEFVQKADMSLAQGSSMLSMVKLGKSKGYELAATTLGNCIFVQAGLFPKLGIPDNSIQALRADESKVTYIFNGYDGTIFLRGPEYLPWHGLKYDEARFQMVPRFLRTYPDRYTAAQKFVKRIYAALFRRGMA